MSIRRLAPLALAASLGVHAVGAQDTTHRSVPPTTSCFDRIPTKEMRRVAVYGLIEPADTAARQIRPILENLLLDVATQIGTLLGTRPGDLAHADSAVRWNAMDAPLNAALHRNGHVSWSVPTGRRDTTGASLIAQALDALEVFGGGRWTGDMAGDSAAFRFVLRWPQLNRSGTVTPPKLDTPAVPLFSIMTPWFEPVVPKPRQLPPQYPSGARVEGYGATVILQFIVDTSGRADTSTIREKWPKTIAPLTGPARRQYEAFVDATKAAVARLEFSPALVGGCKVRQLVEQPFVFNLQR